MGFISKMDISIITEVVFFVGKFKVDKIEYDYYQVTEMYDNPEKNDWRVVFDSLHKACYQNNVDLDIEQFVVMRTKSNELNL